MRIKDARLPFPFTREQLEEVAAKYGTPFYVYDVEGIRNNARRFNAAFSWVPKIKGQRYRNYFAVKALPNPNIISILHEEEGGADCSSRPELRLASEFVGMTGEEMILTANDVPIDEFRLARELGAVINFDDIVHVPFFQEFVGDLPELVCFRYNPGPLRVGNNIIGNPVKAKYGVRDDQIVDAFKMVKDGGAKRFGLHTMIVSNMRDEQYLIETARMLFRVVNRVADRTGIEFEFVNLGGGVGIPYKPDDKVVDLEKFGEGVRQAYDEMIVKQGRRPLRVVTECGRAITGDQGWLVSRVRHVTDKYRRYVGLDSCMANLARPALYEAHHGIIVPGKEDLDAFEVVDVTGGLCENNDKFAEQRELPKMQRGDLVAMENAGAHGHAMGGNYNGKLRCAEFLFYKKDGRFEMVRRHEEDHDLFATLAGFEGAKFAHLVQRR